MIVSVRSSVTSAMITLNFTAPSGAPARARSPSSCESWAYPSTVMIGKRLARAISPKPSISSLLPGTVEARPRPSALTRGTVTVDVVTPPESYASGTIVLGANAVCTITIAYPAIT